MFEYLEIITERHRLKDTILCYQISGWEVVSHAMYSSSNISLLFRKKKVRDDDR